MAIVGCQATGGSEVLQAAHLAHPAGGWDGAFRRITGWTGADGVYSIALDSGRTLWLFGDTWIGGVADGKHAPGSHMVNNSIAIQHHPSNVRPAPSDPVEFLWGPVNDGGDPTAWIVPTAEIDQRARELKSIAPAHTWYWPLEGAVVSGAGGRRLVLLLAHVGSTGEKDTVWSFTDIGSVLAIVENVDAPASQWRVRQVPLPVRFWRPGGNAGETPVEVRWGAGVFLDVAESARPAGARDMYVYGTRSTSGWCPDLVVARVPASDAENASRWQFFAGPRGWVSDPAAAESICSCVVAELSVDRVHIADRDVLVMVQSAPVFGTQILLRVADRPEGPWSRPVAVYDVPGVAADESYFPYAAKGHGHLSSEGRLLVSYVINSHDFWTMASDANIYRPRFVRVPVAGVVERLRR